MTALVRSGWSHSFFFVYFDTRCSVVKRSVALRMQAGRNGTSGIECSPMLRMLSNVRNAIECSLLLSLVCRKSRNSKVLALAAVLLTSERSQLSCTQAVTRNVWGRVLQRLKSIATFNIWKRVFEFNNQFSVQGRSNIEQHFLFHLPSFFLSFFILRLCILPCRTSSCTIGK